MNLFVININNLHDLSFINFNNNEKNKLTFLLVS